VKVEDNFHIANTINEIGEEVEEVLESSKKEKYFEEIILLYSVIEYVLKWSLFCKIFWERLSEEDPNIKELQTLGDFCGRLSFYNALNMSLSVKLIDYKLYKRVDRVRSERNDVVHQVWLYGHRKKPGVIRKKLERLTRVAKELINVSASLTNEIGTEKIFSIKL